MIGRQATSPFFLYMAFAHMHVPQFCSAEHCNATGAGPFADALAELDATVGSIVASLEAASKTKDTVVFLTGDNGPWEAKCELTGSKGPFRGAWQATHGGGGSSGKFTLWEGGACFVFVFGNAFSLLLRTPKNVAETFCNLIVVIVCVSCLVSESLNSQHVCLHAGHRVVGVISWPGHIKPGSVSAKLGSTLDFFPTASALAGVALPSDRVYDGIDFLSSEEEHTTLFHPNSGTYSTLYSRPL